MNRPSSERTLAAFLVVLATCCHSAGADEPPRPEADRQAADLDAAEARAKQAIVDAKKLGPDHVPELVEAFVGLSDVYLKQGRMTEANLLLEQSLFQLAQTSGTHDRLLDRIYLQLGTVRVFQNNVAEAESLLKRALVLREKRLGPDHLDVAELLERLANLVLGPKSEGDASALYKRALSIRENAPGARPADVIKALSEGADWFELRAGDEVEAEAIWKRLLALQERTLGPEHRDVADTLMKIVACHLFMGESGNLGVPVNITRANLFPDEATAAKFVEGILADFRTYEPMLERARAIREKTLGPDHADTIRVIQYLAAGYLLRRDWSRLDPLYRRILTAREKALGPENPELAGTLKVLATSAMTQHKYREAIPYLKRLAAFQATEKAKAPRDHFPLTMPLAMTSDDEVEKEDPGDFAAQLRKATRLAALQQTPDALPTEEDLAFLKSHGWCPANADLAGLPQLTGIDLKDKPIDDAGLAHLRGLVSLKSLAVHPKFDGTTRASITDAGLATLRNLTALQRLDLNGTAIRGTGLSALRRMNDLRWLKLSFTSVDDAGLASLPILPGLERLELSGTRVTDASIPVLKKFLGLKDLWLYRTKMSEQGVAELREAMPDVKIHGNEIDRG